MKLVLFAAILSLVIITGCVSTSSGGLSLNLQADPPRVFSKSTTTLHIDVDNQNNKQLDNVFVKLFDAGNMQIIKMEGVAWNTCEKSMTRILPFEFQSFSCTLLAPEVPETTSTTLNALVSFRTKLSATQIFEMMSEKEYERRTAANSYGTAQSSYAYRDTNVEIAIDFSETPPLVVAPDKKYYVYITVRNIGQGFLGDIKPGDLVIRNTDPRMALNFLRYQTQASDIPIIDKESPRIAYEIVVPQDYFSSMKFGTGSFVIEFNYNYEFRKSLSVDIIK